ncbi:hypothetical protein [Streptosporangium sp. V21-05]|uniref:hypothetical protein n=1 Tax=Streptosporangium sp. V21-05 TaxID=3446115 RepID=UPI003F52F881
MIHSTSRALFHVKAMARSGRGKREGEVVNRRVSPAEKWISIDRFTATFSYGVPFPLVRYFLPAEANAGLRVKKRCR